MKKHNFKSFSRVHTRTLLTLLCLLTLGLGQMWAGKGFFDDGMWQVKLWDGGSDYWTPVSWPANGASIDLGVKTTLYLKGCKVNTWSNDDWTTTKCRVYYWIDGGDSGNNYLITYSEQKNGNRTWTWDSGESTGLDYDAAGKASSNGANPGNYTLKLKWKLDESSDYQSLDCGVNFTYPGFTTTSTSQTFDNTLIDGTNDKTISFGTHYGTALTTSNCALSGTNASDFSVQSITESGVTVRFYPRSAGSKSATLTITDAHSKTCTISLSGKTKYLVTYDKGSYGTGDQHTAYKIYGTSLTLANSGYFTRTGYHQTAWNTNVAGSGGTNYNLQASYLTEAAITLYPTWTANTYTIHYDPNDANYVGTATGSMSNQGATWGSYPTLSNNGFSRTGYTFAGWATSPTGDVAYSNGQTLTANLTNDHNATVTLYAKWTEKDYTVTVNAGDGGSVASGSVTGHIASKVTLPTATPNLGYYFTGWTRVSGSTVSWTNQSSASTAQVNGLTAAVTVQANFAPIWRILGSQASNTSTGTDGFGGWDVDNDFAAITHISTNAGGKDTGYVELTLEANKEYQFKMFKHNASGDARYYGNNTSTQYMAYTTATKTWTFGNDSKNTANCGIRTAGAGTYKFAWNFTDNKLTITFPTSYTITYGKVVDNGLDKGGVSATGDDGSTLGTGKYVAKGSATFTAAAAPTGYSFIDWRTDNTYGGGSQLSTSNPYTMSSISANKTVYANYSENMTTVNLVASPAGKGTFTKAGVSVTSVSAGVDTHPAVQAIAGTGYRVNTSADVWSTNNANITLNNVRANPVTVTGAGSGGTSTLTATFTPITYTVRFNGNGNTSGTMSNQTGIAYDSETTLTANAFVKTGYNFAGWATSSGGSVVRADGAAHGNLSSTQGATVDLYAVWTAKQSALTFDYQTSADGYGASGTISAVSATYDAAMPSLSGSLPTAEGGYAFMGFYDATGGSGTKYYNADGTSAATWNKNTEDGTTLYAYYKKAEITNLVLSSTAVPNDGSSITATPTISPTPTGDHKICWELQYSNGTALSSQPTFTPGAGNAVTFAAPTASAIYRIECKLYTGTSCGGGTLLDTRSTTFQVAGEHTVTIQYQDTLGRTLATSTTVTAQPLDWSSDITAPDVPGYSFHHWVLGDGITINTGASQTVGNKTTPGSTTLNIKATYAGTLTAVYYKKRVIYFNNTLGWSGVTVYFYKSGYWNATNGTGSESGTSYDNEYGEMARIAGTDIWYYDCEANNIPSGRTIVAFTEATQNNYKYFSYKYGTTTPNNVVYKTDYQSTKLPMFVPLAGQSGESKNSGQAMYYNQGYWMNYPDSTGYVLRIYNSSDANKATGAESEYVFPFSADKAMPLKLDIEFNDGGNWWFMIYRTDGTYYGKNYIIKQEYNDEQALDENSNNKLQLIPSAKGVYTFTLTYHDSKYYIDVDYPIALNDYRIKYSDNAAWSGSAHGAGWYHPSDVINKISGDATEAKKDIVSLYIAKGASITPSMKFQYASAVNNETGVITWTDVASGTIDLSSFSSDITAAGVYNIYVSQPVGGTSITVDSIKPYTGNYYIRTDCAGSTKWDSYKALDHQMTYSDYAEHHSYTDESKRYTHYFAHWYQNTKNVKFCVANDYSVSVSDTLQGDSYTGGTENLQADANIRFMWNEHTNKLSRAYIAGSGRIADRFLVLEGDPKLYDANGNSLTGANKDHRMEDHNGDGVKETDAYIDQENQLILYDDQNFVYERTIKVNASAKVKLTAKYNGSTQYFKGGPGTTSTDSVQLLGGTYNVEKKYSMRIVYDFKTNRLVTAYLPEGEVDDPIAINADLMLVREHQEEGQQLTLTDDGALSAVKTVYGVMRFNRWTLNNKEETGEHDPVADPKSAYERGLYWISFPFDVNLSDVFGFGTYGVDWIIEYYDGAGRAQKGYWIDSPSFWKYVMPAQRASFTLEAGKGYVLALDLDRMKADNTDFWANNIEQVELFFPSTDNVGGIEATNVTTKADAHACTIDRTGLNGEGADINKNRTKADSHWNLIGVPSYANYGTTLTSDGSTGITWNTDWHANPSVYNLPYLYEWNSVDNTYTVQSGSTYPFKAMHAYMVQYHGDLYWSLASATPASIVARRTYAEKPQNVEFRLELQQNEKMIDQTFVKLSDDEEVSANFIFDEDLCKEYNASKANIYTFIENYIPAAGNTLPVSEQTTLVPVGVQIKTTGEYTFSMPDGTEGVGITLIDNETGVRTSLSALDYTVNLSAGTYDNRFVLEISPIKQTPTGIEEVTGDGLQVTGARKVMIDGLLYIVKDGKMFDARGARLK